MTEKQKETICKLRAEIIRLKEKNSKLREKKGLPKVVGAPRIKLPSRGILMNCGECGQRVMSNQPHSLEDCKKYSQKNGNQSIKADFNKEESN
ncbi:unnamed protein product [marine sediment metagenome]|uniref:Uncharacterized protein n=1 Tax=marine sediment metagenome TaxID=412755 RepID=X1PAS5_9ZZZZ